MKTFTFLVSIIIFTSCSTIYKSGQTPDDLYYAKGKTNIQLSSRTELGEEVNANRQIRMSAYDYRWRMLDDQYDYNNSYSPYSYGYNYGYYYNPYYCSYPVYSKNILFVNPKNTTIRTTSLNNYNNTITTFTPAKSTDFTRTTTVRGYNNSNTQTNRSTDYRTDNSNTRTYTPSSPNNNSSSNSNTAPASTGTPVARPSRGQ
jgi:hypothetical protein